MKRILLCGGLTCLLLACGTLYWQGGREEELLERRLAEKASAGTGTETESEATGPHGASATELRVAEALHPPEVRRWTAAELEKFWRDWAGKIRSEEERLIAAGQPPFEKLAAYRQAVAALPPEDLLAVCYGIPPGTVLVGGVINWTSSDGENRQNMFAEAFRSMVKRFPFLSLQLPQNTIEARPISEIFRTMRVCAESDPAAAWEVVKAKFGGKEAPLNILTSLLEGSERNDAAARLELAKSWGILEKVADSWPGMASGTRDGQEAWIAALDGITPADRDARVRNFAKEVETSEGFEGVKRLIPRLAEKGTPLYDSILKEAAGRDLEEAAGPKADWILSQVSPGAVAGTAETLIRQWTATDPLPASEWLDKVPESAPWRKAAVLAFAKAIEPNDPEAAALWRKAGE